MGLNAEYALWFLKRWPKPDIMIVLRNGSETVQRSRLEIPMGPC